MFLGSGELAEFRQARYVGVAVDGFDEAMVSNQEGYCLPLAALPISPALRQRFENWWSWYELTTLGHHPEDLRQAPIDGAEYAAEGRAIAEAVKRELPDWTVVYCDPQLGRMIEIG